MGNWRLATVSNPNRSPGYDAAEAEEQRYQRLGVQRGSNFLNVGVDNQVTWPPKETLTKFDKYHLVLLPKTRDHEASVHIDLATNKLTHREGMTVINLSY